jgi:hypothetical protein
MKKLYSKILACVILIASLATSTTQAFAQSLSVQTSYNLTDTVGGGGNAGVVYLGNEYWVSKWSQDSIYRLTPSGSLIGGFVVPGLTNIKSFTWDGTTVYAANATQTIYKISPVTRTLTGTIMAPIATARFATYSPTANSGAGGLWIGNIDLRLISLTGTNLQTITFAQHGLTGMYGAAYDSITTGGGPYLWISDAVAASNANLVRIPVSTGIPNYTYDQKNDFPAVSGGVAGGIYMTYSLSPGQRTLISVIQGVPNILVRYSVPSLLPVSWVSFSGEMRGSKNILKWTTANEQNSKGFEIQRSADGGKFTTIGFVSSQANNGNSTKDLSYSYEDGAPIQGNNYYRLSQVDKDGKSSLSKTLLLKATEVLKAVIANLYPNPVRSVVNISVNSPSDNKITFMISDMKGMLQLKQTLQANAGTNIFTINAQRLSAGTFIVKAVGNDGQVIGETKFFKQ